MNLALYLVVILSSAVSFSQGAAFKPSTEPYQVCIRGCKIEPPQKHYVCVESGRHFYHPCHAECANTTNPDFLKPEDMKVVECEAGGFESCWNTECTDQERIDGGEPKMCDKAPPHTYRNWPCQNRCTSLEYEKKDLELVPCSEVKKN